jgi:hypothetical protein
MVRDFNIEISVDYGWEIDIVGFIPPYSDYDIVKNAPVSFGVCRKQDDKIVAIYDSSSPSTEAIKEVNELSIFLEECNFYDEFNDYKFKGTFVDALIYIQNKYIEYKLPTLEEIAKKK